MGKRISFLKRELRIAMGDRKAFNKEQKALEKKGRAKEARFKKIVKNALKGGIE